MADDIFSSLASFCYPERDRKCLLPITSLTRALITEKPTVTNIRDCVYFIKGSVVITDTIIQKLENRPYFYF